MKSFNIPLIALILVVLGICLSTVYAQEEGPAVKRISLRRPVGKAALKTTTTTTTPASHNDEGDDGEYGDENPENQYDENEEYPAESSSTTTTTTEAPKKIGPVIRPFRTNDDFLNSLKRRQMNAKKNKVIAEKPTPKIRHSEEDEPEEQHQPEPPKPKAVASKGFKAPSLNRRQKPAKPVRAEQEEDATAAESEQQQQEQSKPKRPSGRLTLRRRV